MIASTDFAAHQTDIPGLIVFDVSKSVDDRGYFQEKFQQAKLRAVGLPSNFQVVQNNITFNKEAGVTRGLHAEPWDKYISVVTGKIFCAWVDLRIGHSFGHVAYTELNPEKTVFVPRGVANGYQTLEPDVIYSYLVNAHWSASGQYQSMDMFDPELQIPWPISQGQAVVSEKDMQNPLLADLAPMEF